MLNTNVLMPERTKTLKGDVFLERIPQNIYQDMVDMFEKDYHFKNGERMRLSNYAVKISRSLSDNFVSFIHEIVNGLTKGEYPSMSAPNGFAPNENNLLQVEVNGGFSLGSFDMAVTEQGLQNIEFQSVATYPISAARLNQFLLDRLPVDDNAYIFADNPNTNWDDFINLYDTILGGKEEDGIVLIDRNIAQQKTNFEFFATQKELNIPIEIVDMKDLHENEGALFYAKPSKEAPKKITRLYNRILLAEALFEDNYPEDNEMWKFRFDRNYKSLKFVNHPIKQFEVSKRLSPFIDHPYNPECYELSSVADDFKNGHLNFNDFIWKHKWGAAGHRLLLSPTANDLDELSHCSDEYIAQKKVAFKIFKTDDGQEKIVELRFMTAIHNDKLIIVPMARIGHIDKSSTGNTQYKIHFGDNNKAGYGFSPVIIFDE